MSMNSLIQRLTSKGPAKSALSIVILSDGIYLSKVDGESQIQAATFHELKESSWDFVLQAALDLEACNNVNATVTLGSRFLPKLSNRKASNPKRRMAFSIALFAKRSYYRASGGDCR